MAARGSKERCFRKSDGGCSWPKSHAVFLLLHVMVHRQLSDHLDSKATGHLNRNCTHTLYCGNQLVCPKRVFAQKSETTLLLLRYPKPTSSTQLRQTPLKGRHWQWEFAMNMIMRKLTFYLSGSYVLCCTVCKWQFILFSISQHHFLVFDEICLHLRKFVSLRCSLGGFLKASALVKLYVISWILLRMCLEMGAGMFASDHVFHYYKNSI